MTMLSSVAQVSEEKTTSYIFPGQLQLQKEKANKMGKNG